MSLLSDFGDLLAAHHTEFMAHVEMHRAPPLEPGAAFAPLKAFWDELTPEQQQCLSAVCRAGQTALSPAGTEDVKCCCDYERPGSAFALWCSSDALTKGLELAAEQAVSLPDIGV